MKSYGQFCSIARALDLLGERWTLLVVRELLCGSSRFGDLRRGLPRISRTMLAARLRELLDARVIEREPGPRYKLTGAGLELAAAVRELGAWGQRWLPRDLPAEELDADALVWDMQRQVNLEALPSSPTLLRIDFSGKDGRSGTRYLLLRRSEVSLCSVNPGFPETLRVRAPLRALVGWWRGDFSLADARHAGLVVDGRRDSVRAFPGWFRRYAFAAVRPADSRYGFRTGSRRRAG